MQCITDKEVEEWLRARDLPKDTFFDGASARFHLRFYTPVGHRRVDAFVRHYLEQVVPPSELLIHVTDWSLYEQSEMIAISGIRSNAGEIRGLVEAPGHVLNSAEKELCVAIFSLAVSFSWSSNLYSGESRSILFNWEGDVFDFWSDSEASVRKMKELLDRFELAELARDGANE